VELQVETDQIWAIGLVSQTVPALVPVSGSVAIARVLAPTAQISEV
jgi:hypothetical protein